MAIEVPVEESYLVYLDRLREAGVTNMFGSAPYLTQEFPELDLPEARKVLSYWMQTFGVRHGYTDDHGNQLEDV